MIITPQDVGKYFADEEGEQVMIMAIKRKKVKVAYEDNSTCDYLMEDIYPLSEKRSTNAV